MAEPTHVPPVAGAPAVALVGVGRWGRHILRDLISLGCDVTVVARSQASRDAAAAGGATVVPSIEELPEVAGIVVATPTATHAEVTEAALARGVPVYVEKPLTADPESARRLAELGDGRLFVMDKWRYHPGVLALAAIAAEEELGPARSLHARRVTNVHRYEDVDTVWIHAPHDLAIALEVFGELPPAGHAFEELLAGERVGLVGVLGPPQIVIEVSAVAPDHRREVRLVCENGVARLDGGYADAIEIAHGANEGHVVERRPIGNEHAAAGRAASVRRTPQRRAAAEDRGRGARADRGAHRRARRAFAGRGSDGMIDGVRLIELEPHHDERGTFLELHRLEWETGVAPVQWNAVRSEPGVLRGVHVHPRHDDYLLIHSGSATVGLADLRPGSETEGMRLCVTLDGDEPRAIVIPHGVAHGFMFREPSLHIYAVSHYWDTADELGVRWDDPDLAIPWPQADPLLSERDRTLPRLNVLREQLDSAWAGYAQRS